MSIPFHQFFWRIIMLNNRLKEYREKAGLSQTELAWRARIAGQNISAIERGTLAPWPRARKALAEALKVSEIELFPEENRDGKDSG
jgi:transcriptional regulator with XRE-family HTH domain